MSLFQRRPQTSDPTMYYSVGLNKTVMLVGLGNPGKDYDLTRHNVGFLGIDEFAAQTEEMQDWMAKKDIRCLVASGQLGDKRVIAVKPTTFMNLSGEAVRLAADFYKIQPDNIVVIHDELDIDFGQIRLRVGGASAGHRGIESVTKHLGEDYGRVRVGVGPKQPGQIKAEDFVLQKWPSEQQAQLPSLTREVNSILNEYLYGNSLPHDTRDFLA